MPKLGQEVDAREIQKINDNFRRICLHYFFIGRDFKFEVNIVLCQLAPLEKCVRAKEDAYVDWMVAQILGGQFKDDRQTIVVMPQGLKRMPTLNMWPAISKRDLWLIDGQYSVEASKKIELMTEWNDPHKKRRS